MKYSVIVIACFVFHFLAFTAHAERPPLDPKRNVELVFGDLNYNSSSQKKDIMYVVVQDGDSGRTKVVKLNETEVNSSTFAAITDFGEWADLNKIYPEVYLIPTEDSKTKTIRKKFAQRVQKNLIPRAPIIFKTHSSGLQIVDIYKDRQDLVAALDNYKKNMKLIVKNENLEKKLKQKLPEQVLIDRATRQNKIFHLMALERKESQSQIQRNRKQQNIEKTIRQKVDSFKEKSAQEKAVNKVKAQKLSEKALEAYKNKKYGKAKSLFQKSYNLEPTNTENLFNFGICLYRLKEYENSIVYLNLSDAKGGRALERDYFLGLNLYQLQEIKRALIIFRGLKAKKHPTFSPSAAFYEGLILYSQEKFVEAKEPFNHVIETSSDPKLDDKAEEYLQDIAWKIYYKKSKVRKWIVDLELQAMHDSNILFATDDKTDQGTSGLAEKEAGARGKFIADVKRRIIYSEKHEFSAQLETNLTHSQDKVFKRADPLNFDLEFPYSYKTSVSGKAAQITITPGAEQLYMDANDLSEDGQENIQTSGGIDSDFTIVYNPHWVSSYQLNVESINSNLKDAADGLDDSDSLFVQFSTNQSLYFTKDKKQAIIPSLGYINNAADGDNKTYDRMDFGLTYLNTQFWNSTFYLNLNYYQLNFPNHDEERKDNNRRLFMGLEKPFAQSWRWGLSAEYSSNSSNVTANNYTKSVALASIAWHWEK